MKHTDFTPENIAEGIVLLVDKPLQWTSFDVVNKLRYRLQKICGTKLKVGHAGTLDPLATGLLIIGTGKMTRSLQLWQDEDKEYTGEITLGATTPSYDAETEPDAHFATEHLTPALVQAAVAQFVGEQAQYPPIFSAIKVNGKALYKSARQGQTVDIQPRTITISEFEITKIALPQVQFRVRCSKGTYIRSLAYDFGKALGSGGFLSQLTRTRSGNNFLADAWNMTELVATLDTIIG